MSDNYADETKPLFKLLRTEAFRFVIVRYNHFSLVQQLEKDLKSLFPNRPLQKVDAQKLDYQRISKDYFSLENGFFFIQNFDSLLKEDKDRFGKETPLMSAENERRRHITAGLNLRRDKLAKYPIALFVFLPARGGELFAKIIMEKMPDLWSFRSIILDLETTKVSDKGNLKANAMQLDNVSDDSSLNKNKQLQEFNRLLSLLKKTPKHEVAYRLTLYPQIVDAAIAIGKYKEALSMLDKWETQANDNDRGDIWLNKGWVFTDMGSFDKAQKYLAKALTFFDKSRNVFKLALTFFRIGNTFGKQSDYVEAIASFEKAIALKPDFYEAFSNMGLSYSLKGESIKAIESYEQVIAIKPDFYEALNDMGFLYALQGKNLKAIDFFEQAIAIKPDDYWAFNDMGYAYYKLGNYDKAIECYQKSISITPNNHKVFYNMGDAYFIKGDYDKAIECYQKVLEIKPDYHKAFYSKAKAYYIEGDNKKAIKSYQKAIEIKHDYDEAFHLMGLAYDNEGEYEKAIESYQEAIKIQPDNQNAYTDLGFCLIKFAIINEAETILLKAIELGGNVKGNMYLGHVYLCKNEEEKAVECYKTSLSHFENKDNFWKGMKDDYQYLVQYGITEAYYQSVLEKIE
jgi:tetratricopeptide (TPR) repeat protein